MRKTIHLFICNHCGFRTSRDVKTCPACDNGKPVIWQTLKCCNHPGHNFPTMLYIPPGKSVTHTCPGCGHVTTCRGTDLSW